MKKAILICGFLLCTIAATAAEILVKQGEIIVFLGDSITAQGARGAGYVNLVSQGLKVNGITIGKLPAGVNGHKSDQMLVRIDHILKRYKPQWVFISCGVNDVFQLSRKRGIALPEYKKNIAGIVEKSTQSGAKVAILTATMLQEDAGNSMNATLAQYNDFLREFARENNLLLFDVNKAMQDKISAIQNKTPVKGYVLTVDGIHMNTLGNIMMAETILRGLGLDDAQISKAHEAWTKMRAPISESIVLSVAEYQKLADKAFAAGKSIPVFVNELIKKEIR